MQRQAVLLSTFGNTAYHVSRLPELKRELAIWRLFDDDEDRSLAKAIIGPNGQKKRPIPKAPAGGGASPVGQT